VWGPAHISSSFLLKVAESDGDSSCGRAALWVAFKYWELLKNIGKSEERRSCQANSKEK